MSANIQTINDWGQVPGSNTYFTTSDVTPFVNDQNEIVVYDAIGVGRSWGTPSIKSQVIRNDDQIVIISIKGWHKHTISPVSGTFYFINEGGKWVRRRANHKLVQSLL